MNKAALRFFALVAILAFGVFCKIHYSSGDDAFFDHYVHSMCYLDYIQARYSTWTGRIGGESLVYLVFTLGIWAWRAVNALMVAAVPMLLMMITGVRQDCRALTLACAGYLLMDIITCGHAAVWVNGSIFYTWSLVCALLCIYFNLKGASFGAREGGAVWKRVALLFPLIFFAASSIEQIGFALLAFFVIAIVCRLREKEPLPPILMAQAGFLIAVLAVVLIAPGNSARVAQETEQWFPAFAELHFAERAFISIQWLLSSIANEGKLFLVFIWVGCLLAAPKKSKAVTALTAVFTAVALLPFAHVTAFADTGISYIDPAVPPDVFPSAARATALNIVAIVWWAVAGTFTFYTLKKSLGLTGVALFAVALLCEAMMFFSPTIYASGERVFYVTDWILLAALLLLLEKIPTERAKNAFVASALGFAVLNLLTQVPEMLAKLNG